MTRWRFTTLSIPMLFKPTRVVQCGLMPDLCSSRRVADCYAEGKVYGGRGIGQECSDLNRNDAATTTASEVKVITISAAPTQNPVSEKRLKVDNSPYRQHGSSRGPGLP